MALHARVYCNCYETGRHKTAPPAGVDIEIYPDGSVVSADGSQEAIEAIDAWVYDQACEHCDGEFMNHGIGNITLVSVLKRTLQRKADRFPILISKVVYNGVHAGDYLTVSEVQQVHDELQNFSCVVCEDAEDQKYLTNFHAQMTELTQCALRLKKPIVF